MISPGGNFVIPLITEFEKGLAEHILSMNLKSLIISVSDTAFEKDEVIRYSKGRETSSCYTFPGSRGVRRFGRNRAWLHQGYEADFDKGYQQIGENRRGKVISVVAMGYQVQVTVIACSLTPRVGAMSTNYWMTHVFKPR